MIKEHRFISSSSRHNAECKQKTLNTCKTVTEESSHQTVTQEHEVGCPFARLLLMFVIKSKHEKNQPEYLKG